MTSPSPEQRPGPAGPTNSDPREPTVQTSERPGPEAEAAARDAHAADRSAPCAEDAGPGDGSATAELEDRWRRSLADLDNLRKRYGREVSRERAAERDRVAEAFLPVLDNIDLALRHAESDPAAIVEGVRAIRDQALAVLARLGYPRQEEAGVPFDPARHEVVALVPGGDAEDAPAPGWVVDVVRPGYGDPDRQLRPASVTVASDRDS
jgi:molecular chaperone GrpE